MTGPAIPFAKASACGNDFLIIDGMHAPPDLSAFSRRICDRHNGVGADGVEWLFPAQDADIRARLINADGSDAEISGNGTRCVAAYLCSQNPRAQLKVRTGAGIKNCVLTSHSETIFEFETAMGEPQVGDEFPIKVAFGEVRGTPVSMGNPHYVVFVDEFAPGWQADAAENGKEATRDLVAKIGRASRLGERSRGVLDAGAASGAIILQTMATILEKAA